MAAQGEMWTLTIWHKHHNDFFPDLLAAWHFAAETVEILRGAQSTLLLFFVDMAWTNS